MIKGTSKVLTINDENSLYNDHGITSVDISPNGQFIAAGSLDTIVRIWDMATAQLVESLRGTGLYHHQQVFETRWWLPH